MSQTRIGVIGGTGLYDLFEHGQELEIATPYGQTSSPITLGEIEGKQVAFLTRHGRGHSVPPHKIPYRANIWALASLGVKALLTSSAVGGLQPTVPPGTFVIPTQIIDRTYGREQTFFDEESVQHLVAADPFDTALQALARDALTKLRVVAQMGGTVVVIPGPRFATRAESQSYASAHYDIINMTMAPEVFLAMELGMGVVNVSFITDSDSAVARDHEDAVTPELVTQRLAEAQPRIRQVLADLVSRIPEDYAPTTNIPQTAIEAVLARKIN